MARLSDPIACESISAQVASEDDYVAGQYAVEKFEWLRSAYDPCVPGTGEAMIHVYLVFQELGYEAYFRGLQGVPPCIADRPHLATIWTFGFDLAEFDAASRRCRCDCDKSYAWGKGYGTCPRTPQGCESK